MIPLMFVIFVTVATVLLGFVANSKAKNAADFFVAGRSVGVMMNASAISGEYLSAASFMGIAGLVMKNGYDALWYPVGYAAGYLFLLLFIAGPLRRFGAYTIPDFAEGRFNSTSFRKIAVTFVLFIGFFYTMPQMKAAGVTMATILNWPYWVGIVIVGSVITFNVAVGGMKGITLVQSFQYWAKVFAISVPLFIVMSLHGGYTEKLGANVSDSKSTPRIKADSVVSMKGKASAPANALAFTASEPTPILFPEGAKIAKISLVRKAEAGEDPIDFEKAITLAPFAGEMAWNKGVDVTFVANQNPVINPVPITKHGEPVMKDGKPVVSGVKFEFADPCKVRFLASNSPASSDPIVPNAQSNKKWVEPFGTLAGKWGFPLLTTYSLIIALVCGTAGLPHILVRFYTNPDGRSAKRTTLWVMVLLGAFYVFTPVWGTLGRSLMPILYASNTSDTVVIKLPTLLENKTLGLILSGVTSAGAFAAFMSTFSGLLVSMSGAFAHDIYGRILRPESSADSRLKAFKVAAVAVGIVSMGLGLLVETFDIATMVGWAFAIGAASYFPLLLLGSWWRGLTHTGAATGMLLGGLSSLTAIVGSMLLDKKVLVMDLPPIVRALMEQPAIWGVPLSLATMWIVSLATAHQVPKDVDAKMLRLHAPEELGFSKNYIDG